MRTRAAGKEVIKEVELTGGRGHPGQKSWIISFSGIDTVEEVCKLTCFCNWLLSNHMDQDHNPSCKYVSLLGG